MTLRLFPSNHLDLNLITLTLVMKKKTAQFWSSEFMEINHFAQERIIARTRYFSTWHLCVCLFLGSLIFSDTVSYLSFCHTRFIPSRQFKLALCHTHFIFMCINLIIEMGFLCARYIEWHSNWLLQSTGCRWLSIIN